MRSQLQQLRAARPLLAAALAAALCLAALGCGSSGGHKVGVNISAAEFKREPAPEPTEAAFRRRVERMCANVDSEILELSRRPGSAGSINAVSSMGRYGLAHVRVPAALAKTYAAFIHWMTLRAPLVGGFFGHNVSGAKGARYARLYRLYTERARRAARRAGLGGCPFR